MTKNQEYIEQYAEYAIEQMKRYGIPASVTLAQGICESSNGKSDLAQKGNNHFGMKASKSWVQNGGSYLLYDDDKPNEKFCQYASVGDSFEHHSKVLANSKRYAGCFKLSPDDYKGWTQGLQNAGYASNKGYASSLQKIIETNDLQKYDQKVMAELKSQGKAVGTIEHPRQTTSQSKEVKTASTDYSFPLKRSEFLLVTSPYGMRNDPINKGQKQMHKGVDVSAKYEDVLATEGKGKVIAVNQSTNTGGGRSVTVEYNRVDGSKVQCTYMHLDSISVAKGDCVKAGQKLGVSGNSGTRTTGAHLHFGVKEVDKDGTVKDVDPAKYLAEIAVKGSLSQQVLCNGKDLMAQYKPDVQKENSLPVTEENNLTMSPQDWMKKLLSSEDSSASLGAGGDPLLELAFSVFTGLMALAVQVDSKDKSDGRGDEEKNEAITQSLEQMELDLTKFTPTLDSCKLSILPNGTMQTSFSVNRQQYQYDLPQAQAQKLQSILSDPTLTDEQKIQKVGGRINSMALSQMVSRRYEEGMQQGQSESLRR